MTTLAARRSGGLPDSDQSEPFDKAAYRHQGALFKSMHCARPVLYRGRSYFIACLRLLGTGTQIDMLVYLAGIPDGIDSSEILIKLAPNDEGGDA